MEEDKMVEAEEVVKGGELLFCGATCWGAIRRRKISSEGNLVSPTRLRPLVGVNIRFVASGCASCHCVALDVEGRCFTWGRNEKGQLGQGDRIQRDRPTIVSELSKYNIIRAATGRNHAVVVTKDGLSLSFGWNKHGQLGSGSLRNVAGIYMAWIRATAPFCWCCSSCISWGHALSGELGYGPNAQKSSAVPRKVDILEGMHVISVACGFAHFMVVVNRENVGDRLDQLDVYDGKASGEGSEEPDAK